MLHYFQPLSEMCYLLSGVLKGAPGKQHILVSVLQHGKNLHGHTKKMHPDSLYHTVTLCGHLHDLSSLSTSMSCLISPLLPEFTHSFSQRLGCPKCCPMRLHFLAFFFLLFFWPPSISVLLPHLQPSKPPTGRQLWIIKWWIRAYFLPTQTGDCWASSSAIGLIPLSTRNSTKSHRCLSSFGRKTVDSPAHPHVSSTPGSTRLGSSRLKFLQ